MTDMIVMQHVAKAFGNTQVLNDFSLNITEGRSTVIFGGSGSGKSVCLKCLLGLLSPDAGAISIKGVPVHDLSQPQRARRVGQIGMLFQNSALFDSLSVWRNVAFGLIEGQNVTAKKAYRIAIEKLAQVGLEESVAHLLPNALSGGMRKRVGLARAIATEPEILFFDEPTTGLDPIMGRVIDQLIVRCVKELGATAVTITHDMHSLRHIADDVVMLYKGRDLWQGSVSEIDTTDNAYVRQFVEGSAEGPITMPIFKLDAREKHLA